MKRLATFLAIVTVSTLSVTVTAADWPQFRGPNGSASSPEINLPTGFSETSGLRWKVSLPGRGLASPVIVGNRAFVTSSSGQYDNHLHVICIDTATGAKLWHRELAATGSTTAHPDTCMAAPTPVADKSGVYTLFASGDLAAFDNDGTMRWYRSLVEDYPSITNQIGMASSLVLFGDKLIVPMDNAGESFLAAIDTKTGKNTWKVARPRDINWVTPLVRPLDGGKAEVLFLSPKELIAYDIDTGAKKWATKINGSIPTPTLVGDLLISPSGGVTVAKLGKDSLKEVWKSPKLQTGMSSPVFYEGFVYGTNSTGIVKCANAKTGEVVWEERVKGKFSSSPIAADGKLFVFNEAGVLTTIKLGATPEIIAESPTNERGQATPAISGGAIFLRGEKSLFCIGSKVPGN